MPEMSPLSRAIARHVGVDLSPEAVAARNRRGIAVIVHGAPQTGQEHACPGGQGPKESLDVLWGNFVNVYKVTREDYSGWCSLLSCRGLQTLQNI